MGTDKKLSISLQVELPSPQEEKKYREEPPPEKKKTAEEEIRYLVGLVETGQADSSDWQTLCLLSRELHAKEGRGKLGPRGRRILEMVDPTLEKFGYYY